MSGFLGDLIYAGRTLLWVAMPLLALRAARRNHDARSLDLVWFLLSMALPQAIPAGSPVGLSVRTALYVAQPYLGIRLIRHFAAIPSWLAGLSMLMSIGFFWVLTPAGVSGGRPALQSYAALVLIGIGMTFLGYARRVQGVKATRMYFAGAGSVLFGCLPAMSVARMGLDSATRLEVPAYLPLLEFLATLCYFLAFTPPRRLTDRWRRASLTDHLARSTERDPEERGWLAANDLVEAVQRALGSSAAFVVRVDPGEKPTLSVSAASDLSLVGAVVDPASAASVGPLSGTPTSYRLTKHGEAELDRRLRPHGEMVLVAPIQASGGVLGLIAAVHRRGALFPQDDLAAMVRLGRITALAIEHSELVRERRALATQAADRRLRELESRVGAMVDSIRDYAMWVVSEDGRVAAWHLGAVDVFGVSKEHVIDLAVGALLGVSDSTWQDWLAASGVRGVEERETTCRRADGTSFTGVTSVRPLVPEPGLPPGFVVVTRDVSARRRLEERLRQGQKMESIGTLASGVAHDFNNILAAILGNADQLETEFGTRGQGLDQIVEIQRAAERGADLTRQLLAFGRAEVLLETDLDLNEQVRGLMPMLRRLIDERFVLVDETAARPLPICGSRGRVEQVILNLAVNARDAMPGGGKITFRTGEVRAVGDGPSKDASAPHVLLEVADEGVGMDADTRRRAFDPFFTTKGPGEGAGLGLSTVYGIVTDMRGLIDIESAPGLGTTVRVFLPSVGLGERALGRIVTSSVAAVQVASGATVLLVEDDGALRDYFHRVLSGHGYRVLAAAGAHEALSVVAGYPDPIAAVISDVMMPGMSGPELVVALEKLRPGIRAVLVSGLGEGEARRLESASSNRWLQKPFTSDSLLEEVAKAVSGVSRV